MIALIKIVPADDVKYAGITFKARWMEYDSVDQMRKALRSSLRHFESNATHQSVDFIAAFEQLLGQIAAILPGDTCD